MRSLTEAQARHFGWASRGPAARVLAALETARPGSARFVGGCVRDSLLGVRPKDIDIATQLTPDQVAAALKAAALRYAPTGIEHGTITAIAEGAGVEVTTLRADVSTDGRRATVAFTENWETDARRRDFTINALYLTVDGKIFDPVGGLQDLEAGRVRFIGAPGERIREDYLRILRFFRFSARFAKGFDADGVAACVAAREGLACLSAERIGDEFCKILALPGSAQAVALMRETGVLAAIWPAEADAELFARLKSLAPEAGAPLGLAALWGERGEGVDAALRLSNKDAARRRGALRVAEALASDAGRKSAREAIYRHGVDAFREGASLAAARAGADEAAHRSLLEIADTDAPPPYPFTGKDVIALGVAPGPRVARALKASEQAWIAEDFPAPERARALLKEAVAREGEGR